MSVREYVGVMGACESVGTPSARVWLGETIGIGAANGSGSWEAMRSFADATSTWDVVVEQAIVVAARKAKANGLRFVMVDEISQDHE